jgi:hypothetical protein
MVHVCHFYLFMILLCCAFRTARRQATKGKPIAMSAETEEEKVVFVSNYCCCHGLAWIGFLLLLPAGERKRKLLRHRRRQPSQRRANVDGRRCRLWPWLVGPTTRLDRSAVCKQEKTSLTFVILYWTVRSATRATRSK